MNPPRTEPATPRRALCPATPGSSLITPDHPRNLATCTCTCTRRYTIGGIMSSSPGCLVTTFPSVATSASQAPSTLLRRGRLPTTRPSMPPSLAALQARADPSRRAATTRRGRMGMAVAMAAGRRTQWTSSSGGTTPSIGRMGWWCGRAVSKGSTRYFVRRAPSAAFAIPSCIRPPSTWR